MKIQEELGLKETTFYREAFEQGRKEGGRTAKLAIVPLSRKLGLSDEVIAKKLGVALSDVHRVSKNQ